MIDKLEWKGVLNPDFDTFKNLPDVPVYRALALPPRGDVILAGMYVVAAGVVAYVEQEHKFGSMDFKVIFHRLSTKEVSTRWHNAADEAMADLCTELMLPNPTFSRSQTSTMQEQYSEETGCGLWS
jgi:hypothetical protein